MKRSPAAAISDAVLYEGYLLYPYRESATKNQYRWTFGCLFPQAWCEHHDPSDRNYLRTEFLIAVTPSSQFDVRLRCLVLPQADEAAPTERDVFVQDIRVGTCVDRQRTESFSFVGEKGHAVDGQMTIDATEVGQDLLQVSISVWNTTQCDAARIDTRDRAAKFGLLSAQLSLACQDARFLSLTDPPEEFRSIADECRNEGCWPVLAGLPGSCDQLLVAPIILSDYPQVAPESRGEFFDALEIDEILTMRIRTLTDKEKVEMAQTDPRADELLRRTESTADDELSCMHAEMKQTHGPSPILMDDHVPESLIVNGIELRPGDQVRLRPSGRSDIFDMALDGRTATIETIERDFGDELYFTVTANCDPGRDFGQQGLPGHRFFFRPQEVEPLGRDTSGPS
ncbi:MAG: hypothetical protein HKN47_21285 [Pirellulaceae bacterium]|nr:hypothetical protein [Pirellulaceae bacterium]